ncbi:MAG: prolipoprotein diacylglyceryl transferase [Clostridia bacterium]|nr:prolipoprotein diacylglyceryl transferase [Clostridia bacterium]
MYNLVTNGFTIFGFEIRFYGILIDCAMLIAVFLVQHLAKKRGINPDDIIVLALIVIPFAIIGARAYYCIFSETSYTFKSFWNIRNGGLAIYGGIIGGVVAILIFCAFKRDFKLIIKLFDVIAPALILGQAIGRWGNFFNQEAYGYIVTNPKWQWFPFAVKIETYLGYEWHLATFFYESMWNLIGFILLLVAFKRVKRIGTITGLYLTYYGLGRLWIEGLRTDSLYLGPLRVSQWLSAILVVIGTAILVYNYIKARKAGKHEQKN